MYALNSLLDGPGPFISTTYRVNGTGFECMLRVDPSMVVRARIRRPVFSPPTHALCCLSFCSCISRLFVAFTYRCCVALTHYSCVAVVHYSCVTLIYHPCVAFMRCAHSLFMRRTHSPIMHCTHSLFMFQPCSLEYP